MTNNNLDAFSAHSIKSKKIIISWLNIIIQYQNYKMVPTCPIKDTSLDGASVDWNISVVTHL